jgi:hypothetical protein
MNAAVSGRDEDFGGDGIIFYINGQSIDSLAFRVVSALLRGLMFACAHLL